ncbi:hypothetical protein BDV93DRAFT_562734 [Ceratobasidium sp. AG-I]|nr:hypothetical protein BDV93DRAFT_562734 [Ceratobasidium sp. AG-I]
MFDLRFSPDVRITLHGVMPVSGVQAAGHSSTIPIAQLTTISAMANAHNLKATPEVEVAETCARPGPPTEATASATVGRPILDRQFGFYEAGHPAKVNLATGSRGATRVEGLMVNLASAVLPKGEVEKTEIFARAKQVRRRPAKAAKAQSGSKENPFVLDEGSPAES